MSFVQDAHGTLVCELWPEDLRFASTLGVPLDEATLPQWQIVPADLTGFSDWAYIYHNAASRERSRAKLLLYRHPAQTMPGTIYPVKVRLQGFVQRLNLQPLGTWDGNPERASAAIQSVVLSNGDSADNYEAWESTIRAVDTLRTFAYMSLGAPSTVHQAMPVIERHIYCQRRVFTKVRPSAPEPSVLRAGDDPYGHAAMVDTEWRVVKNLSMGRVLAADGRAVPCDHTAFRAGDFVDIGISLDIAAVPQRRGNPRVDVHIALQHILLLREAEQNTAPELGTTEDVQVVEQDLSFD
ncbi:hypothetical protein C8R44DRAFT_878192 [Mycena epipterygia]|nr:hypothetical protein C8R44DRAFT_878192 [Mycena epipterygia]